MARCSSCSAPLPANVNLCCYCGTRNDVDLQGRLNYRVRTREYERTCPNCENPLQTIELDLGDSFLLIERCSTCYGLFLDRGEIETLLQHSVSEVFDINLRQLCNINKDRYHEEQKIRYVKCPVCSVLMNRVNYGRRSGVVVDECKIHGIWLDSGEITHLMEWKKAGGQLLDQQQKILSAQEKKKQDRLVWRETGYTQLPMERSSENELPEVISALISWLFD